MRREFREGDITVRFPIKASFIAAALCCVLYTGNGSAISWQGEARGVTNQSVQDGNWNDTNTWLSGQVPTTGDGLLTFVNHNVVISDAQDSIDIDIGNGGSITVTSTGSHVGDACCGVAVGAFGGGPGTLIIEGTGNIDMFQFPIGSSTDTGTLVIRPTANGIGGFTPILSNITTTIDANSVIELDISLYYPSNGDAWDILETGIVSGTFGSKVEPAGVTFDTIGAKGLVPVSILVTGAAALPAATYWSLGAICVVLALGGAFYVRRLRRLGAA